MVEDVQYYVEGDDEKKFLQVLKTDLQVIRPGKIQVFNVANKIMTKTRLITLKKDTTIVVVFDTDAVNLEILNKNIEMMNHMPNVKSVLTVLQVQNLEDELTRCCRLKRAEELIGSRNKGEFKSRFLKISNLDRILIKNGFDIDRLWKKTDFSLPHIRNDADWVKL